MYSILLCASALEQIKLEGKDTLLETGKAGFGGGSYPLVQSRRVRGTYLMFHDFVLQNLKQKGRRETNISHNFDYKTSTYRCSPLTGAIPEELGDQEIQFCGNSDRVSYKKSTANRDDLDKRLHTLTQVSVQILHRSYVRHVCGIPVRCLEWLTVI